MQVRDRVKELRRVRADTLIPNARNWRRHPQAQADALRGALAEIGYADALLVRETPDGLQLIDGHLRAETTPDMEVPVLVLDVDEAEADKLLATLDPLAAMAVPDPAALEALLAEVTVSSEALQAMLDDLAKSANMGPKPGLSDPDDVPEPAEPISKTGDLWVCGDHRLLCGDSTKAEDVKRLMAGETAALFATDPPYGCKAGTVGFTSQRDDIEAITKDDLEGREMQGFLETVFHACIPHLNADCAWYLWHPMLTQGYFAAAAAAAAADLIIHRQIIWVKEQFIFGRGDYHWQHELCFYGWRQGNRPGFHGERNQSTVWSIPWGEKRSAVGHPTAKPVELFEIPLSNHTVAGAVALDPFLGSGTTMIACERLGRRCFGMEIAPNYVDVAVKRWEQFTGKEAQRG